MSKSGALPDYTTRRLSTTFLSLTGLSFQPPKSSSLVYFCCPAPAPARAWNSDQLGLLCGRAPPDHHFLHSAPPVPPARLSIKAPTTKLKPQSAVFPSPLASPHRYALKTELSLVLSS
ncbi:hypothetical protein IWZ01DRAFT_479315 [Phyllosticta capitalensis]